LAGGQSPGNQAAQSYRAYIPLITGHGSQLPKKERVFLPRLYSLGIFFSLKIKNVLVDVE